MLFFSVSCATRNIKYDRNKILKKTFADYKTFLDNEEIYFPMVFFDKGNIENIKINKRDKILNIKRLIPKELFKIKDLSIDSLYHIRKDWDKINLVIIDGLLIHGRLKEDIRINPNAIKHIELTNDKEMHKLNLCNHYSGNVLLITTK